MALQIALEVARRFRDGTPPLDAGALSEHLDVPVRTVREVVERLREGGILSLQVCGPDGTEALQLGRPADRIAVFHVSRHARRSASSGGGGDARAAELVEQVWNSSTQLREGTRREAQTLAELSSRCRHRRSGLTGC